MDIKNRFTGTILYSSTCPTLREAVIEAIKRKVNLSGSDLSGSNLSGSDLRGSDLSGSNLSGSDLRGSDLRGSDLRGSDLSGSDLSGSNLSGSDLRGSDLSGSNLSGSDLRGSDLRGSDLSGSDLSGSNLSGSDLSGSDLRESKNGAVCRMDFGGWSICVREDMTSIGCQTHENKKWLAWTPKSCEIGGMHDDAGTWWAMHGPVVKAAIRVVMKKAKKK
jgi:hypothetical protein